MENLQEYMSTAIRGIMARAYKNVLSNPREALMVTRLTKTFLSSEKRRQDLASEGVDVPPFLICSISTTCNLSCKGCYARANGIADLNKSRRATLAPSQWRQIFEESASLGINFALLAGGEPLMRCDILEEVATVEDMIFPIFTNGTLLGEQYITFFKEHLNMIPIISIEGLQHGTDVRRGVGVYNRAMRAAEQLHTANLFYGTSITVTTENFELVTSDDFVQRLQSQGCRIIVYVEYVPTEPNTEHLAFGDAETERMEQIQAYQKNRFDQMIILSFPGDEKLMGGCLAAGRGFFHIGPDGKAEPCPFSPFSDTSVAQVGVRGALQSPLFRSLRSASFAFEGHSGGCTLWQHRHEVEAMLNNSQNSHTS